MTPDEITALARSACTPKEFDAWHRPGARHQPETARDRVWRTRRKLLLALADERT